MRCGVYLVEFYIRRKKGVGRGDMGRFEGARAHGMLNKIREWGRLGLQKFVNGWVNLFRQRLTNFRSGKESSWN